MAPASTGFRPKPDSPPARNAPPPHHHRASPRRQAPMSTSLAGRLGHTLAGLAVTAGMLLTAAPAASAQSTTAVLPGFEPRAAANKATALYVFDQLFNHGNFAVIDALV